ncbi:MAG TPA: FHA domain-containing protein [Actinocrinis sp.]|uniref:FHA domain-containing protein n=1 Tax=Actinocrinis sp. TaxID=1920516 RepID=UPI002DDD9903|nr:FHA domain-containing protein [Actinocrinis sp.]HEV2342758.1 FHA domain-containing protein [Actinocrinis sp.]
MQIRLSVTSARDADAAVGVRTAAGADAAVNVDAAVTAAAGTAFSAAAGALRTLAGVPDGRFYAGSTLVRDEMPLGRPPLLDGAVLTVGRPGAPAALPGGLELHVVGGPDAGGVHLISPPAAEAEPVRISIGRGVDAQVRIEDPDLSRLHAELLVTADWVRLRDVGSTNGTTLDGTPVGTDSVLLLPDALVRLGETTLALRLAPSALDVEPDRLGRLRVRTTRRPQVSLPAPRIDLPPKPSNRGLPAARRRAATAFEQAKAAAETQIAAALTAEATLRREAHPDLAALLTTALRPEPRLWARDPQLPGFLDLRLGTARIASRVIVGSGPKTFRPRVAAVPVTLDLDAVGVFGLVGPRPQLTALARSLVAQLAASCAPRDLELVLLHDGDPRPWQWVRWLPHLTPQDGQDCLALVGLAQAQKAARIGELVDRLDSRPAGRRTVLIVDPASDLLDARGMRRLLDEGPEAGIHTIVLATRPAQLPDATGAMATLSGDVNTRVRLERPDVPALDSIVADLASVEWAERFGRALAPLRESDGFGAPQLPEEVRLLGLLDLDLLTPAKLGARWTARPADSELTVGADDHGAVRVNLSGHHILVGGVSGSGISETLRSITYALAATNRPEYLRIALVSGGNGPSLAESTGLPHVDVHLPRDCPPEALRSLLDTLETEVERRTHAVANGPVRGLPADPAHPRMLVVVDGFDRLAADHPWFAKGLAAVARDSRDLALHVAVGVALEDAHAVRLLDSDLSDEAHIRVALRTHGPEESRKLVSLPAAVSVRADTPGRAHLALPDGRVLPIQVPLISGRMPSSASSRATVTRLPWAELGSPVPRRQAESVSTGQLGGPTDLALFVETARRAATR